MSTPDADPDPDAPLSKVDLEQRAIDMGDLAVDPSPVVDRLTRMTMLGIIGVPLTVIFCTQIVLVGNVSGWASPLLTHSVFMTLAFLSLASAVSCLNGELARALKLLGIDVLVFGFEVLILLAFH